jgi:hypothetical protein
MVAPWWRTTPEPPAPGAPKRARATRGLACVGQPRPSRAEPAGRYACSAGPRQAAHAKQAGPRGSFWPRCQIHFKIHFHFLGLI